MSSEDNINSWDLLPITHGIGHDGSGKGGRVPLADLGLSSNPKVTRLKAAFRASPGGDIKVMDPAPTVTVATPAVSGVPVSEVLTAPYNEYRVSTAGVVGTRFSVHDAVSLATAFTSGGVAAYSIRSSGTNGVNDIVIAADLEGSAFDIVARSSDRWCIFADGEMVYNGFVSIPYVAGYSLSRIGVDFGTRVNKRIVAYGQTFGFVGMAVDKVGSLAAVDISQQPKISFMTNSFGQSIAPHSFCGPFLEAILQMVTSDIAPLFTISPGGGSGFIAGGTGGKNYQDAGRLSCMSGPDPDMVVVVDAVNDGTSGLDTAASAVFAAIRAASPNAVIASIETWTSTTSVFPAGQTKQALVQGTLSGIAGPWVSIDVTRGAWANSAGKAGRIGASPWCSGDGYVDHETGAGNSDVITSSDAVHPSPYGCGYYGRLTRLGLGAAIQAL